MTIHGPPAQPRSILKPISAALSTCRTHFTFAILFSAAISLLHLAPAIYMLQIYDRILSSGSLSSLGLLSAILAAAVITLHLLESTRVAVLKKAADRLAKELDSRLGSALIGKGPQSAGRAEVVREFDTFRSNLSGPPALAILDLPWAPVFVLAAALVHPLLGGLVTAGIAVLILLAWRTDVVTRVPSSLSAKAADQSYHWLEEAIHNKEAGPSADEVAFLRHSEARLRMHELQEVAASRARKYLALTRIVRSLLQSGVTATSVLLVLGGTLSPGAIVAASIIATRAFAPIDQLLGAWRSIGQTRRALTSLNELLGREELQSAPMTLPRPTGSIEAEALTVVLASTNRQILSNLSLAISPGQLIAVSGPSGAGKSILLRCLAGLMPVSSGHIYYDGLDIRSWNRRQLANQIGYLGTVPGLRSGTVADNISGRYSGGPERERFVAEAAALAGVHEMICRFPQGYNTPLGPAGFGLSSGEAYLVGLARAAFGHPSAVLLDDCVGGSTAECYQATERAVKNLRSAGITTIIASNAPAILRMADKVLPLASGRLAPVEAAAPNESPRTNFHSPSFNSNPVPTSAGTHAPGLVIRTVTRA